MSNTETKSTASTDTPATEPAATPKEHGTLVDLIFDLGTEWATYGLGIAKTALEQGARTLERLANSIDALKKQLATK